MSVLDDIIVGVRADLADRMAVTSFDQLVRDIENTQQPIDVLPFLGRPGVSVIAEVKRESPSKGALATISDPAWLAGEYEAGGASAISVLTERRRFGGSLDDLDTVRASVTIPVLRKDFIVDRYQVAEARAHGADVVLLIVAALNDRDLRDLYTFAGELDLAVLVETHTPEEVLRALDLGAEIIGVNNRNLKTLDVDLNQFEALSGLIGEDAIKVAESGIFTIEDVATVVSAGADAILVGEALVRDQDPRNAVSRFASFGRQQ